MGSDGLKTRGSRWPRFGLAADARVWSYPFDGGFAVSGAASRLWPLFKLFQTVEKARASWQRPKLSTGSNRRWIRALFVTEPSSDFAATAKWPKRQRGAQRRENA